MGLEGESDRGGDCPLIVVQGMIGSKLGAKGSNQGHLG